jgi:subtilisin family serine protease
MIFPIDQVKLRSLMDISKGMPEIAIGVIDGPVDFNHPSFRTSRLKALNESQTASRNTASDMACTHGTFVTGILCGDRHSMAPAVCPEATILLRPIFDEYTSGSNIDIAFPTSTPQALSKAIVETVDAGARIINLSIGLSGTSLIVYGSLEEAYNYARQKGVIVVVSAGNQGNIGYSALINNRWVIPVTACDENGMLSSISNFGPSIGIRGVMAPGVNITSTSPRGNYTKLSGTSFAAPFVTATIALLWSIFPTVTAGQIIQSLDAGHLHNRAIIPSLLNAEAAWRFLKNYN